MKNIFILIAFLWACTTLGQESAIRFNNLDFKAKKRNIENYSLSDSKTNNLAIILAQKEKVYGYLYSSDFKKIGEATGAHIDRKYKKVIGYSIDGEKTYTLVFSAISNKRFGYISFDLEKGETTTDEVEFKFDGEQYLETINFENRLVMMSATKNNVLILREFTSDFTFEKIATFQLDSDDKEQRLLRRKSFLTSFIGITKIENRVPNTIERSSKKNKFYHQDDKVYITFEEDEKQTILCIIDLTSLALTTKLFEYPEGRISDFKNHNSFIHGENLFHIASSRDEMIFQVKNFNNEILKEYYVDKESEITFKNSSILQSGSTSNKGKRELKTTKQFLRKITNGNIGLSILKEDENYQITLGSSVLMNSGGVGFVGAPMGGTTISVGGGNIIYTPAYNPTFLSFNGYVYSKAVYINALFDADFNHIKETAFEDNIFDRIKDYKEDLKWNMAEDIFIHNNKTYFSSWNVKGREYHLLEF
ncbi:MAG: hypothetical protein ACI828_001381 [Flavobacteriales bacterium]|jgi:hypothetical protein